jgi:putative DNA primase/helicase
MGYDASQILNTKIKLPAATFAARTQRLSARPSARVEESPFDDLAGVRFGSVQSIGIATEPPLPGHNSKAKPEQIFATAQLATGRWARSVAGDLYRWNDSHWELVDDLELGSDAWAWLTRHFEVEACDRAAGNCVRTIKLTKARLPSPESRRVVIACQDHYLEAVGSGASMRLVRIAPDPSMGFTSCVPIALGGAVGEEYVPGRLAGAPLLARFFDTSIPDLAVRSVIQDYVGYTLIPPSVLNLGVSLVMVGAGGDGKGLLSNLVSRVLHRHSSMAFDIGAKDGFSLQGLESGISLATVDELPINEAIASKDIKSAISGDSMSINRKGRARITVRPTARFLICGNDLPRFDHGGAAALERRFIFVPFNARLSGKDRIANLEHRIVDKESRAFLDWALAGALRVAARRVFDFDNLPEVCRKMSGETIEQSDSTLGFIREFGVAASLVDVRRKDDVYHDFVKWAESQGMRPLASQNFYKRLLSHLNAGSLEAPRAAEPGRPRMIHLAYRQYPNASRAPAPLGHDEKPPFDD